ncbi:ferrous iron transport protein A [Desulfovibrio sp. UCD-KL4C]|uniref:FeoA family protein n=1 Tax=Desulfovibrio sp. UCD-KL4C TaxID=2578120 RepID=UPI0025C36EFD|nr:ferrous iron transport protein A [Desulfovibrio sp. UCD-KL4C]
MNIIPDTKKPRPLSCYKESMSVRVISLEGGRCFCGRLLSMGIIPGTIINVLSNCGRMTIRIRSSEYALGKEMAKKIFAIPICGCSD